MSHVAEYGIKTVTTAGNVSASFRCPKTGKELIFTCKESEITEKSDWKPADNCKECKNPMLIKWEKGLLKIRL